MFDGQGLPVRELCPFGMASATGLITWDGLFADSSLAPEGIYLVVADYYHPSGRKGRWKGVCAVVRGY